MKSELLKKFVILSFFLSFFLSSKAVIYYSSSGDTYTLSSITFNDDVEIGAQTTVIIPFGVTVKLKSGKKITVGEGAKLVVSGTIDYDENPNDVLKMAFGVIVRGNLSNIQPNISQVINGNYPGNNSNTNGVVIIEGGVIKNMFIGVYSIYGGIVYANNYTSINNYSGVKFSGDQLPLNLFVRANPSLIQNSSFVLNEFWHFDPDDKLYRIIGVHVIGTYGIKVLNCSFENTGTWLWDNIYIFGVVSEEGGIIIRNCSFSNFNISWDKDNYFPIKTNSILSHLGFKGNVEISNCLFENCIHGILSQGVDYLQVKGNTFIAPVGNPQSNTILLNIIGGTGLKVANNEFKNFSWTSAFDVFRVMNSGNFGTQITGNIFVNCRSGIDLVENNRGVILKCNSFITPPSNFSQFISVYANPDLTPFELRGIPNQGAKIRNDINGTFLPGNKFYNDCGDPTGFCDFAISDLCPEIDYYCYGLLLNNSTFPSFKTSNINVVRNPDAILTNLGLGCSSVFSYPDIIQKKSEAIGLKNEVIINLDTFYSDPSSVISFLDRYLEGLDYDLVQSLMENSEDSLVAFLNSNQNYHVKCLLTAYYLNHQNFESAVEVLNSIDTLGNSLDLSTFKSYHTKLIDLIKVDSLQNISTSDFDFFNQISSTSTFTAAKAKTLLERIVEANNSSAFDATGTRVQHKPTGFSNIVFPNPAIDKLDFSFNKNILYVDVYSITGEKVDGVGFDVNTKELWVSNLKSGTYFVILTKSDFSTTQHKFIKR